MHRAVGVYIANGTGDVLLVRRSRAARHEHGRWEGVGGEARGGESFEDAARREAREEVGVSLLNLFLLKEDRTLTDEMGTHWHAQKFLAYTQEDPRLVEGEAHDALKWVHPESLSRLALASYAVGDTNILQSGIVDVFVKQWQK